MLRFFAVASALWWLVTVPALAQGIRRLSSDGETAVIVDDLPLVHAGQTFGTATDPNEALQDALSKLDEVLKASGSDLSRVVKLNLYAASDDNAQALRLALQTPDFKTSDMAVSLVVSRLPVKDAVIAVDAVAVGRPMSSNRVERKRNAAVMPEGSRIYVSGQAERGESLREATQKTMASLVESLEHCGRGSGDMVQLKCFVQPMSAADEVMDEITRFFAGQTPPAVSLVEWKSAGAPIEIEAVAWGGSANRGAKEPLEFLTPPGMTASPVFSRVARINRGNTIYFGDLFGEAGAPAAEHVQQPFATLKKLLAAAGSDLKHLAKATYYVTDDEVSKAHNGVRPSFYDPARPPAASKAVVASTGRPGVRYAMDMIAVSQLQVRQITSGPLHHFFGYIGHVQNVPWNKSGRYLLTLRTSVRDHLPTGDEPAEIVLLDAQENYKARVVEQTRAWNPQQGTMLYWNPEAQETQFFFNDRDAASNKVFCVLFDVGTGRRVREYRFEDSPVGNGGVAQRGGKFLAINYGRMANLRRVTGYAGAFDWTGETQHPADDGVFVVDVKSGERKLLASFARLADELRSVEPAIDRQALFINHTLWSRDDSRIYFYVRGGWDRPGPRVNVPVVMNADGTNLRALKDFIGGHPEWLDGTRLIGTIGSDQVIYDTDLMRAVGKLGDSKLFPKPGDDIALSPSGEWFCNGYRVGGQNSYAFLRLKDGVSAMSGPFDVRGWTEGDLRVDPAPWWNRESNQILISALAADEERTRQLFLIKLQRD